MALGRRGLHQQDRPHRRRTGTARVAGADLILRNPRTGAVLAHRVERASTPLARLRGLLGRSALPEGEALLIDPCALIHTFFMRFPIDAAFLTRDLRVVRAILDLKPWRATRLYREAAMVVELPGGTLARTGTREGDVLAIEA